MTGVGIVDDRRRFAGRSSSALPAYSLFRGIERIFYGRNVSLLFCSLKRVKAARGHQ